MSQDTLRERLADYGVSGDERDAGGVVDLIVAWLADRKLRVVPEQLTNVMWNALFNQSTVDREWADVLKAAPSNRAALTGKDDHDAQA